MLVKYDNKVYRLPVRPAKTKEQFEQFKERNKNCEILIFALEGGHLVVSLDALEFHDTVDERLHLN